MPERVTAHRFQDEWLLGLVRKLPDPPLELVERWRSERRPYLSQALLDAGVLSFDMLAALIRDAYRIESVQLAPGSVDRALLALVPDRVRRKHRIVPVAGDERSVTVAMANPLDPYATKDVESATSRQVVPLFCPPGRLHELEMEQFDPDEIVYDLVRKIGDPGPVSVLGEVAEGSSAGPDVEVKAPVVKLVNGLISQAVRMRASDIHIEHEETSSLVRYRIDGVLRNVMVIPRYVGAGPVVARIKIMARLDIAQRLRPQDGRAKLKIGDEVVGLRVSTLPSANGEKVVLRILDERSIRVSLPQLGLDPALIEALGRTLARDRGLVLVTGPTGSGKTTTLYAALRELATEQVNVVTVEDPIEYRLPGITQVQVSDAQGLTFAGALRSVLRQDPDVILVGEIRDTETASVAVQAALTGHLVLATLHTNDAVGAVVRLGDMGVEPFKLGSALLGVTAQRLVRRLCDQCAQPIQPHELDATVREALAEADGSPTPRRAVGCPSCGYTGYVGRLPVIEFLEVTDAVRSAVVRGSDGDEISEVARAEGTLRTLEADALASVARGRTSLEECAAYLQGGASPRAPAPRRTGYTGTTAARTIELASQPAGKRIVVAIGDPVYGALVPAALHAAGHEVEHVQDGPAALARIAASEPDGLVVGPGLTLLDAAQVVGAVRKVMNLVDLPIVDVGGCCTGDAESVSDTLLPPMEPRTVAARIVAAIDRRDPWADPAAVARPPTPPDEVDRIRALRDTGVLDTPPEERFDRITRAARERLGVPMAAVSLVDEDRQWFKSRQGMSSTQTPRDVAFCAHGINDPEGLVVRDSRLDIRFTHNPLVDGEPGIRSYAGIPIVSPDGHRVGMMCVMDGAPHDWTPGELAVLEELSREVSRELWPAPTARAS